MPLRLKTFDPHELDALVALSLRAWEPVFASIENAMDADVFLAQHPDWRVTQRDAVESVCGDEDAHVCVAIEGERVAGFVALKLHLEDRMGEVYMVAVDPDFQRRGIAGKLTSYADEWFKNAGMTTAMVETGGDPGHAPARHTYESAGYRVFPVARYFKKI